MVLAIRVYPSMSSRVMDIVRRKTSSKKDLRGGSSIVYLWW